MLEARRQPYVLAVFSNHCLRFLTQDGLLQTDPAELADAMPDAAWRAHAAGMPLPWIVDAGFERWVLIRRSRQDPKAYAYYLVFAPSAPNWPNWPVPLACAGPSRNVSNAPRRNWASITARRA